MESPALLWISTSTAPEDLARLVAHEVAHQWFYAVVGNNQAQQPFADEAVATFLADTLLGSDRSSLCSAGRLDKAVYEYGRRCYAEVIYLQGALYLERYRAAVGKDQFWTGMRQYYETYRFGLGGTRRLLDALDAASGYDSHLHAKRFPSLYH
jgi:aminopeptidase N